MPMEPGLIEHDPERGPPVVVFHAAIYAKELRIEVRHGDRRHALRRAWDEAAVDPLDVARYAAHVVLNTLGGIDGRRVVGDIELIETELFDPTRRTKETR